MRRSPRPAPGARSPISDTGSGARLVRLAAAPSVARVVASSEPREMGMGPPPRTAARNASTSLRWPLSGEPHDRLVARRRPAHTVARRKLSRRADRPPRKTSKVSFGKREWPLHHVGDGAERAVGVAQGHLEVVAPACALRGHLDGLRPDPPAQGVDEVATLADKARALRSWLPYQLVAAQRARR